MKILMLNYEYPPIGGGGGVISQNIAIHLAELGNDITVLTTWFPGLEECEESIIKIVRLKSLRKKSHRSNPIEMLSWVNYSKKYIDRHVKKGDFDLCFANFTMPGGGVGLYIRKKLGIPYVIISHGHDIPWVKPISLYPLFFLNYFKIKNILRQSGLNFLQTHRMKDNCDRFLGKEYMVKNCVVPNACDGKKFYSDYTKRGDKLRIIFVGRLVKQKDPVTFIETLKILNQKGIQFIADIYGDGPMRRKILTLIRVNKINSFVRIHGKVSHEKMREVYQSADLMIAPSISEGMSISALEALFCGVYLFATPVSGFPELIKDSHSGQFIKRCPKDIAEKVLSFLSERKVDSFNESFRENYDWKKVVLEYERLLKQLV